MFIMSVKKSCALRDYSSLIRSVRRSGSLSKELTSLRKGFYVIYL